MNEETTLEIEETQAAEAPDAAEIIGYGALGFATIGTIGGIVLTIALLC